MKLLKLFIALFSLANMAFAIPSDETKDTNIEPSLDNPEPSDSITNASTGKKPLGLNCKGHKTQCKPCKDMKYFVEQIATLKDDVEFSDGEQIVCNNCHIGGPLGVKWSGICVFPQKMGGEPMRGHLVKELIGKLAEYCEGCGSIPVDGVDVNNGELTVNHVTKGCGRRVCDPERQGVDVKPRDGGDGENTNSAHLMSLDTDDVVSPADITAFTPKQNLDINCRGGPLCLQCHDIKFLVNQIAIIDDAKVFREGQQIACNRCGTVFSPNLAGVCVFTQKMNGHTITAKRVKKLMETLVKKCKGCGSVPLDGKDVNKGELTANWVRHGCGKGVCPT